MTKMALEDWQLAARRAYPLELKIALSLRRIEDWYRHWHGAVIVSFSGGKDSQVLLHLVRSLYPQVRAVFANTGLEYPEINQFVRTVPDVDIVRPVKTFNRVITEYGWPMISRRQAQYLHEAFTCQLDSDVYRLRTTGIKSDGRFVRMNMISKRYMYLVPMLREGKIKISDMCCEIMKKRPLNTYCKINKVVPFTGVTAAESKNRDMSWKQYGCNAYDLAHPASRPLMAWSEQDILRYLKDNNLTLAACYGDIVENADGVLKTTKLSRTGCMFCGFGAHLEKRPNRFEQMKTTHPKLWHYIINRLNAREIFDICGVPYGDAGSGLF